MKPAEIFKVLDLAQKARNKNLTFNPLFEGDAGVGKSEICQAWAKKQKELDPEFGFLDIRLAYFEGPDFVGLPKLTTDVDGKERTSHILPDMWPAEGTRGLLLIEEPNRANSSVMNCMMQLLTDRKIHNYKLPDGWVIAACINPDSAEYDVNTMDSAMKNRFEIYKVLYDQNSFIKFMKEHNWNQNIVNFVESGTWLYKRPNELGDQGVYISPRTWSKMNAAELCDLSQDRDLHIETSQSILGLGVGREYYNFTFESRPVTLEELMKSAKSQEKALDRLKKYCEPYRGDLVSVTVTSLIEGYGKEKKLTDELVCKVAKLIPQDQARALLESIVLKDFELNGGDVAKTKKLRHFVDIDPELKACLKRLENPDMKKKAVATK